MKINICCSGSSGSTLFGHLLDRHPSIACGPELNLFSKLAFYDRFWLVKNLTKIVRKYGIYSFPYSEVGSIFDNLEQYGLESNQVWRWVQHSKDFPALVDIFENYINKRTGKFIWAEKTPRNIRVIGQYINRFPQSKVIHIVRDPRDVVMSLQKRGFSFLKSAEIWLAAVYSIQPYRNNKNFLEIRYEDLVCETNQTLNKVCEFIGVRFDPSYFESCQFSSKGLKQALSISSWDHDILSEISDSNINKYKSNLSAFDDLYKITISKEFERKVNPDLKKYHKTIGTLMGSYSYPLPSYINILDAGVRKFIEPKSFRRQIYNRLTFGRDYIPIIKY